MSKWVAVTEALPEFGQRVLVYTGHAIVPTIFAAELWEWFDSRRGYKLHAVDTLGVAADMVSHWCALPPPPESA